MCKLLTVLLVGRLLNKILYTSFENVALIHDLQILVVSVFIFYVVISSHRSKPALTLEDFNNFDMVNLNLVHGYASVKCAIVQNVDA